MKDYYDIYYISHKFDFEGKILCEALCKTFDNRERKFTLEQFEQIMTFDANDGMQRRVVGTKESKNLNNTEWSQ